MDIWYRLLNVVALVAAAGTILVFINTVRTWKNPVRGIWTKLGECLVALACIGYLWILVAGRLLYFNLNY
jgi:hypothetical protein